MPKWQTNRNLALFLGLISATLVGLFNPGIYLQATILNLSILGSLAYLSHLNHHIFSPKRLVLLATGATLSVYLAITTNPLVNPFTHAAILFVFSLFLIENYSGHFPSTALTYIYQLLHYLADCFYGLFKKSNYINFFSFIKFPSTRHLNREHLFGLYLALPLLIIFHLLFSQINTDYAIFMHDLLQNIWEFIRHIFEKEIFWIALKTPINGFIFYLLLSNQGSPTLTDQPSNWTEKLKIVIGSLILLFAVFSFFQSRLILSNFSLLPFKQLSVYTQQGFWQLLIVSAIGYLVALFAQHKSNSVGSYLAIFSFELILITVFSYHKLVTLINLFGLKDQRVLAFVAISLIFMTFILFIFRLFHKFSAPQIFATQIYSLLFSLLLLNILNVDLFITRTYPLHYYVDSRPIKDYSYLLGNSYDNYSTWPGLITELLSSGYTPPQDEYYWGHYQPLTRYSSLNNPSYIIDRYSDLDSKYTPILNSPTQQTPKNLAKFNWREYQAFRLISSQKNIFSRLAEFLSSAQNDR